MSERPGVGEQMSLTVPEKGTREAAATSRGGAADVWAWLFKLVSDFLFFTFGKTVSPSSEWHSCCPTYDSVAAAAIHLSLAADLALCWSWFPDNCYVSRRAAILPKIWAIATGRGLGDKNRQTCGVASTSSGPCRRNWCRLPRPGRQCHSSSTGPSGTTVRQSSVGRADRSSPKPTAVTHSVCGSWAGKSRGDLDDRVLGDIHRSNDGLR
jgi:hypothetical protein